ncbi:hypothetical protein M1M34_gp066 [Haloarcula tailed virus 2]|uniref:Uncharacterized protein n=1 Tax=Haloarcula tailed virus 2 TaxID=2877989 RepID=A0AAE8XYV9_9CAUD|nr:hypothetical protein M1M34_gp066 [Haloarcula tailed virus 2]UBF23267.1 hypothetical protein HATV-2_gp116 [Haloarcula tailed virus 2]
MNYTETVRQNSFCGACEAGIEHECTAYDRQDAVMHEDR